MTRAVQFSVHALQDRCLQRLASVVTYGDVQGVLASKPFIPFGQNVVVDIKTLPAPVVIRDPSAYNGQVKGDKVKAICNVSKDGVEVITVVLNGGYR